MQEMREGEVLSLPLLPVWEEADAAVRAMAKLTYLQEKEEKMERKKKTCRK